MKKPNDLARQVMARAADHHAKLADLYEQLADIVRRYAVALRNGDVEPMLDAYDELNSMGSISETKNAALNELSLLQTADPEFFEETQVESRRRRVSKLGHEELLLELLIHSAQCRDPQRCEYHRMLEERARNLR